MDKRYQVFVSSTYTDLKDERDKVMRTIISANHMHRGMEWFPATDEDPLAYIRPIIDDCDYYVLIIKARYGSLTKDGISMTEAEFQYAEEAGKRILVFAHSSPNDVPDEMKDEDPTLKPKLDAFRERASAGRTRCSWKEPWELATKVQQSLGNEMQRHPAVGWVRADVVASADVLSELNEARKESTRLRETMARAKLDRQVTKDLNLAGLNEKLTLQLEYDAGAFIVDRRVAPIVITWGKMFALIAPLIIENPCDSEVRRVMAHTYSGQNGGAGETRFTLSLQQFYTIRNQFEALGLVQVRRAKTTGGGYLMFWYLTDKGRQLMLKLRAVKAKPPSRQRKAKREDAGKK